MTINELKRVKIHVDFRELETTLDQLLSKRQFKSLADNLQGEKDSFVIQDVISDYVMSNITIDDVSVENLEVKW